jgi:hypothetical protein
VVEWLTLLILTREISISNLGPKTGNPEIFRGFPKSLQASDGTVP